MKQQKHEGDLASTLSERPAEYTAPVARTKRYVGEEAQRVTWRDCRAANELAAKMLAGQIDPMSIVVAPPQSVNAVLSDE